MTTALNGSALSRAKALPLAAIAGAVTVAGFEPIAAFPVPIITLGFLIALWQRAPTRRDALLDGFVFGLGFFLVGVSWVYVSLHDFGAMPAPLAGALTLVFCVYLALFPAITGWIYHALGTRSLPVTLAALPALWTITEWLRGLIFPWIALGYAQVPSGPLGGYIPILGIYGATLLTMLTATLVVESIFARKHRGYLVTTLVAIWAGGYLLSNIEWTHPEGEPVAVSLLQGNVPQEMKWREDTVRSTLIAYRNLVTASNARLIVLPETALPLFVHDVPQDYLEGLAAHARANHGDVLIGVPERGDARSYYNSVLSFGAAPTQTYRKSHLVPFGEFVPLKPLFGWFLEIAQIPLLDFARGAETQQPLGVAGQKVAVNICYEDAFGAEIIHQLPQATLLANVSNVAWFGHSIAPRQHLQISQARALETGRYMLRATNTGMTAIIDQRGRVLQVAPEFTTAVVNGDVQGYAGSTPYVRWGDIPVLALALALALLGGWLGRREAGNIRELPMR